VGGCLLEDGGSTVPLQVNRKYILNDEMYSVRNVKGIATPHNTRYNKMVEIRNFLSIM